MVSDSTRRIIAAALAAVLFVVVALVLIAREESGAEQAREQQAEAAAYLAATEAALTFEHSARLLAAVSTLPDAPGLLGGQCEARVRELQALHPEFQHLAVVNPAGDIVCSTAKERDPSVTLAGDAQFRRAVRSATGEKSGLVRCPVTGRRGILLQQPIMDGPAVVGVLAASLGFASMEHLTRPETLPAGSTMAVVNREGVVYASFPDAGLVGKRVPEAAAFGAHVAEHQESFIALTRRMQGTDLAAYARIQGLADDEDAYARVTVPGTEVRSRLWALATGAAVFLGLLWATGSLAFSGFVPGFSGAQAAGNLAGRYKARRDGRGYAYEVSWSDSATGLLWEAKIRLDDELVGLPSGEIPAHRGQNARRLVRRAVESAIEHRLAQG